MREMTNKNMEMSDCLDAWTYSEAHGCWCLEDILYTPAAADPRFQSLNIYVPGEFMTAPGQISEGGQRNGYTAKTAPVIFRNNSAGYMQMPPMWLDGPRCDADMFLNAGYVYVSAGNRGHETRDEAGRYIGKAPANLIDLKTVIRFLRHNRAVLPGDYERIITCGVSAGGAMSTLLGVTGDHPDYEAYLRENGAFMDESDAVFASQIYCPIIDLEHADLAYEWCYGADRENEDSPAGPAGVMGPFQEALSTKLRDAYIEYFNGLSLRDPASGEALTLGPDGRSGSGYAYLMQKLSDSAGKYLGKLERGELDADYSAADYIAGQYTYTVERPPVREKKSEMDLMQGHAGPGVSFQREGFDGEKAPTFGELMLRPPKGVPFMGEPMEKVTLQGDEKSAWLTWDGERAVIEDLDTYLLAHRRRMKPCTSFDVLGTNSGENYVFGPADIHGCHFDAAIGAAIASLQGAFPEECAQYADAYLQAGEDQALQRQVSLINPMHYIAEGAKDTWSKHFRIRVGARDADTSFTISMALALALANRGQDVDYELVWDQPHCDADYTGEQIQWIEEIMRDTGNVG